MDMAKTMRDIGCAKCRPFGGRGYRFDAGRDRETPGGRVVVCECVAPHCTCGALKPQEHVAGPPYGELTARSEQASDERECVCWPIRRQVTRLNRLLREANIPELYQGKLTEDFRTARLDGIPLPEAQYAVGQAVTWLENVVRGEEVRGLYLHGISGDGKTLLASALLSELILHTGRQGLFVNLSREYFQRLRNTFDDEPGAETTEQAFIRLVRVPFVVLDDLGVERGSPWEIEWLYNLIDARYQKKNRVILTSNHSLDELQELSHGRIASRLRHMCVSVKMPDEDLRVLFEYGL